MASEEPISEETWKKREEELEKQFKDRYTANDKLYEETMNKELSPQPCVYPWRVRDNRNVDR